MNCINKPSSEIRGNMGSPNEWEQVVGRLGMLVDEINRALGWSPRKFEDKQNIHRICRPEETIGHESIGRQAPFTKGRDLQFKEDPLRP